MKEKNERKKRKERRAGILMPISALPSNEGIGTLGEQAYAFIDWLKKAGMKIWQVLPLLPTGYGDSPYQSCASDALNFYFIDLKTLEKDGLLEKEDYEDIDWGEDERRVDYGKLFVFKANVLRKAFARFDTAQADWTQFLQDGKYKDFALFMSLKNQFSHKPWTEWEKEYKDCNVSVLEKYQKENKQDIEFWQFTQYLFLKQWNALRAYAKENGISIMGDMPIYVAYDSVEAWKYRRDLFMLDGEDEISLRAGVSPDAFSDDGQLWGNPVYDWEKMRSDGYLWWKKRFTYAFSLFDILRIDHFRAFDRFYAIPAGAETAQEGKWMDGPKAELFVGMEDCEIVAEDLGEIDEGVRKLLKKTGYPGMKIFEFAFDGNPENEYLPSEYIENCVAYTGTHDNDTLRSFIQTMGKEDRKTFEKTLEEQCLSADTPYLTESIEDECKGIVELLYASKAETVVFPMHDALCMGTEARLNAPSTVGNNWTFRYLETDFKNRVAAWLKNLGETYDR